MSALRTYDAGLFLRGRIYHWGYPF